MPAPIADQAAMVSELSPSRPAGPGRDQTVIRAVVARPIRSPHVDNRERVCTPAGLVSRLRRATGNWASLSDVVILCDGDGTGRAVAQSVRRVSTLCSWARSGHRSHHLEPLGTTDNPGQDEEGLQVYSYGYPLPDTYLKPGASEPTYRLHRRILKGYITRTTTFELPGFPEAFMCELDMQAHPECREPPSSEMPRPEARRSS